MVDGEYPFILPHYWVVWCYKQVAYLRHLYPLINWSLNHTQHSYIIANIVSLLQFLNHLFSAICHLYHTVLMYAPTLFVVVFAHINWCLLVHNILILFGSGLRWWHFDEYGIHNILLFLEHITPV